MKRLNINSRREHKRFMKQFSKDLRKAYENTDYSNYKIEVAYDAEDNTLIIPMPVMALACVDEEISNWISELADKHSVDGIKVSKAA